MDKLDTIFDSYINNNLFKDKSVLQANYIPDLMLHRAEQVESVASILAPALRGQRVSNLFLFGKTGCIAGDSLVYTSNGWKKIKEVKQEEEKVLSFNIKNKKYEWSDFIFLRFENKDNLLKITFDNGQELIVTKDHPLLLSSMKWKKAHEFLVSDEIALAYDLPFSPRKEIPLALARLLGFTISDGSLNIRKRRVKHWRGGDYNSNRQRYRYFSADFNLLETVQADLTSLYECTPRIIFPLDRCAHVNVISQQVCGTLNMLGVPFGRKSSIVQIPQVILEASSVVQREFLKALFSGDGTVSQSNYLIEYYSNSKNLLQQISCLLYQEGISCTVKKKMAKCNGKYFDSYRLYITGQENLVKFYNKIGFYNQTKQEKLKTLLNKYVCNMGIYDKTYSTSKIVKIEETYEEFVYDLTVPRNHSFIANGIISHNTGKTLSVQHVQKKMLEKVRQLGEDNLKFIYVNCKLKKIADTEYRIIAEFIKALGGKVPHTGLPTDVVYSKFLEMIDNKKQMIILVLDEIDQAVKKISDNFIYTLTRMNSELKNAQICLIGISNSLTFMDNLDPRVRSSLGEEEIVFPPYNALQLQDILKERSNVAFKDGILEEGIISKCAAYAAREHGDARRALDLLRVAGELAERQSSQKITLKHIDMANQKIEKDKMLDVIESEPMQFQLVLYAIMGLETGREERKKKGDMVDDRIFTGDVYNSYQEICQKTNNEILTQRRISDILAEYDMLGIINARVVSKGRQGRTREIKLMLPPGVREKAKDFLDKNLDL
ncbi:MAG: LAGLIDADG family homing endonuclease [Nanoarchaeota archaeon]